jgi:GNAT superfamily N-acetyltransferase
MASSFPVVSSFPFSDLALSRRLESAEGFACVQYAKARRRVAPECATEWMECGGVNAVFDGVESPITQSFGLGLLDEVTPSGIEGLERFFHDRGAPAIHEVSPFAGLPVLEMLCRRGYVPVETSSVLYRPVEQGAATKQDEITVRVTSPAESGLWSEVSARGWSHEHPEFRDFLLDLGRTFAAREQSACFLAEFNGTPGAAGVLSIHDGVALFGGSATVPELRRRGLQSALLHARMRYAFEQGCDLAMMVALPGSDSQRNAERKGFRIAYTRTKWQLNRV